MDLDRPVDENLMTNFEERVLDKLDEIQAARRPSKASAYPRWRSAISGKLRNGAFAWTAR